MAAQKGRWFIEIDQSEDPELFVCVDGTDELFISAPERPLLQTNSVLSNPTELFYGQEIEVPGDGSCLYHAVLKSLTRDELEKLRVRNVDILRSHVAEYVFYNRDTPLPNGFTVQQLLEHEYRGSSDVFDLFTQNVVNRKQYAGEFEIMIINRLLKTRGIERSIRLWVRTNRRWEFKDGMTVIPGRQVTNEFEKYHLLHNFDESKNTSTRKTAFNTDLCESSMAINVNFVNGNHFNRLDIRKVVLQGRENPISTPDDIRTFFKRWQVLYPHVSLHDLESVIRTKNIVSENDIFFELLVSDADIWETLFSNFGKPPDNIKPVQYLVAQKRKLSHDHEGGRAVSGPVDMQRWSRMYPSIDRDIIAQLIHGTNGDYEIKCKIENLFGR